MKRERESKGYAGSTVELYFVSLHFLFCLDYLIVVSLLGDIFFGFVRFGLVYLRTKSFLSPYADLVLWQSNVSLQNPKITSVSYHLWCHTVLLRKKLIFHNVSCVAIRV